MFFRRSALSLAAVPFVFAIACSAAPSDAQAAGPPHPRSMLYIGGGYSGRPSAGYGGYAGYGRSAYAPRSYGYGYGSSRYSAPIYHGPSVHLDPVYHPEYYHWTPGRGLHTHGHYDLVPHYTPGHVDHLHGGHIDGNPHYHH
jgi:hypothetical protein